EERWLRLIGIHELCPGVEAPVLSPAAIAREVIEEFLPAPPAPEIDPGYAITGKTAYLETNGNLSPPAQTRPTPLGDIHVSFRGRYRVDWGDGTVTDHDTEGGPWPAGTITHTYIHTGRYDVVVTAEWSADWRIATSAGRITSGLATTGRIDDFEVRQLQAVRNR
ncbi:MAG TPA: PKD domain-containing protein, partial [Acidimicrobiales bacterium]|nr:PKD domain-containing protein [Acidimicrobiales bacterium]